MPTHTRSKLRAEAHECEGPDASRRARGLAVDCTVSPRVAEAIAALGRTEDVAFSPSDRRLAVAAFARNRIVVFDIDVAASADGVRVSVTGGMEIASPALRVPHGVDFLDEDTLIVANRDGDVVVLALPPGTPDVPCHDATVLATWPTGGPSLLQAPGSVSVGPVAGGVREVLVCDGSSHTVSRHVVGAAAVSPAGNGEVLLRRRLDVPDGVTVTADRRWIAVSNHCAHQVLLWENRPSLDERSEPDGILRGVLFPHGLRFSADGRVLHVADAGTPYVHVYAADESGDWRGVRHSAATIRVMSDEVFERGSINPEEGGVKGLAIDARSRVIALTCELLPLTFLDAAAVLDRARHGRPERRPCAERSERERQALEVAHELRLLDEQPGLRAAAAHVAKIKRSNSWRATAPLRELGAVLRRWDGWIRG